VTFSAPPVHSTGRRCAASAFIETCLFLWQAASCPFHKRQAACLSIPLAGDTPILPRALCSSLLTRYQGSSRRISILRGLRILWRQEIAQTLLALVIPTMYSFRYAPGPTCRGSASLYVPPLSYKREGTQRYKADSQVHTHPQTSSLKLNTTHRQWSRVLCSGGLNHSKSSCPLVFFDHLADRQTLRPLLILGFRAGAFRHPAGDFPLRHIKIMIFALCTLHKLKHAQWENLPRLRLVIEE
jgi:hypothetical protein